jgi:hypothetical protein
MSTEQLKTTEHARPDDKLLAAGFITKSGFKLIKKIETLDEFWQTINTDKSIFARHRMYPTAFFYSWNIRLIKSWLDAGWFFQASR